MSKTSPQFDDQLAKCPIVPVLTIDHMTQAVPLARALLGAGVSMIEITLRTQIALEAITEIKKSVPELIVGAGTMVSRNKLWIRMPFMIAIGKKWNPVAGTR